MRRPHFLCDAVHCNVHMCLLHMLWTVNCWHHVSNAARCM